MKKLLIVILVIGVLGAGAFVYLSSNAGGLIRDGVVAYTPPVLGAQVELASVDLDATAGTAALNNMVIGNPEGFSSDHLFKMDRLMVKMDTSLDNLTSDVIRINEVRLEGADMIYEIGSNGNNVGKIQENIDAYVAELGLQSSDDSEKKFIIENVHVNGTKVKVASDMLGGRELGFSLPNLNLTGIGEKENGVIASDAIKQVFNAISGSVQQMAQNQAIGDILGKVPGVDENVVKDLEDKVVDGAVDRLKGLIPPM